MSGRAAPTSGPPRRAVPWWRRGAWALLLPVVLAAVAPAAPAQVGSQPSVVLEPATGPRVADARFGTARITGSLTVAFAGDPATCAAAGRCGLDGVVVWRPAAEGAIVVTTGAGPRGGRVLDAAVASLPGSDDPPDTGTSAQVRRATAAGVRVCTDHRQAITFLSARARGDVVRLGLGGGDVLATGCAGPADADVAALLPRVELTRAQLLRGRRTLDLTAERAFTAAGLTGTVRSTLRVALGRPVSGGDGDAGGGPRRRTLEVEYRIAGVQGGYAQDLAPDPDPEVCERLDTCGLTGAVAVAPVLRSGTLRFSAQAPARVGPARLRAALTGRGAVPPGVDVGASGTIAVDATTTAAVRPGGADTACTDRRTGPAVSPLDGAPAARGAFRLTLLPFAGPRPRCPAPLDDPLGPHTTLTTTLAGGAVGARRLVLRFRRPVTGTVPGFRVTTRPDLTIVLERARVSEQVSPPLPRLAMRLRPRPGRPTSVRPPRSGAAWSRTLPRP